MADVKKREANCYGRVVERCVKGCASLLYRYFEFLKPCRPHYSLYMTYYDKSTRRGIILADQLVSKRKSIMNSQILWKE